LLDRYPLLTKKARFVGLKLSKFVEYLSHDASAVLLPLPRLVDISLLISQLIGCDCLGRSE